MQFGIMIRYDIAIQDGRYDEAYDVVRRFLAAYGSENPCLDLIQGVLEGNTAREQAYECIDRQPIFGNGADWYLADFDLQNAARTVANLGNKESGAFGTELIWVWGPRGRFLRQSPEFKDFARRSGLLLLWQEHGWPDMCKASGDSFECD
jgi:hypothetical protein